MGNDNDFRLWYFVSNAGDVNNDGYADIVVGAWKYNSSRGKVYVYYGTSDISSVNYTIYY